MHVSSTRPERAEAPSPGHHPGLLRTQTCRPVRAEALKLQGKHKAFALTGGALLIVVIPRAMPWARSFWAFSPLLNHMQKLSIHYNVCRYLSASMAALAPEPAATIP